MKPLDPNDRRIANIHQAEFASSAASDEVDSGVRVLQLDHDQPFGTGFHVARLPAGMVVRSHHHNGAEQFLILEGELHDNDGTVFRAGDMVWYREGSEHNAFSPNGCLVVVHIATAETMLD